MTTCKEVMTCDPVCCLPGDTTDKVAQLMKLGDIGAVPVIQDAESRQVVGIITDRDLALQVVAEDRDPANTTVQEIMKKDLLTCREEDDIEKALEVMANFQVRRIPVVTRDHRILGIIAQGDVATRLHEPKKTGQVVEQISK